MGWMKTLKRVVGSPWCWWAGLVVGLYILGVVGGSYGVLVERLWDDPGRTEARILRQTMKDPGWYGGAVGRTTGAIPALLAGKSDGKGHTIRADGTVINDPRWVLGYAVAIWLVVGALVVWGWMVVGSRSSRTKASPRAPGVDDDKPAWLLSDEAVDAMVEGSEPNNPRIYCAHVPGQNESKGTPIFAGLEERGMVLGASRTGKSNLLQNQLMRWVQQQSGHVIVNDVKSTLYDELHAWCEDQGYRTRRWNPKQSGGVSYNPLEDVEDPDQLLEFAQGLMGEPDASSAGQFFAQSGVDVFVAVHEHLKAVLDEPPTIPDIYRFVSKRETDQIIEELSASDQELVRDGARELQDMQKNNRMEGSIMQTFRVHLKPLMMPTTQQSLTSGFSFESMLGSDAALTVLFVQFDQTMQESTKGLMTSFMTHSFNYWKAHPNRPPILQLFDEVGTMKPIPQLGSKMNTVGDHRLPTWLYFQEIGQLEKYQSGDDSVRGACDTEIFFRVDDPESGQYVQDRLDSISFRVMTRSEQPSPGGGIRSSRSEQRATESIITAGEAQAIPTQRAVLMKEGRAAWAYPQPYYERYRSFYEEDQS